jgi:hypothetical protein
VEAIVQATIVATKGYLAPPIGWTLPTSSRETAPSGSAGSDLFVAVPSSLLAEHIEPFRPFDPQTETPDEFSKRARAYAAALPVTSLGLQTRPASRKRELSFEQRLEALALRRVRGLTIPDVMDCIGVVTDESGYSSTLSKTAERLGLPVDPG